MFLYHLGQRVLEGELAENSSFALDMTSNRLDRKLFKRSGTLWNFL